MDQSTTMDIGDKPRIGISSCLLGNEVRFDGGHKHSGYVTRTLGQYWDFSAWCPEVGIGLTIPRPPIRLIATDDTAPLEAVKVDDTSIAFTEALTSFAESASPECAALSGLVVKKDSPSCGMERVKVYGPQDNRPPERRGRGIFTAKLMADHPALPVEEEGRLMDPGLRENFVVRVFTRHRWLSMIQEGFTAQKLIEFHSRHKFLLMAHHEPGFRSLGRLVSNAGSRDPEELATEYNELMMQTLKKKATPKQHANVLTHIMGFIKDKLTGDDKEELLGLIDAHRSGLVPLIVPITLLNHFLRRYPHEYITQQVYLEPHPRELMLRNSI
jgi:uncharacterized protein YbgA (DUF1722 family)/uncharacterized protein YbbK (DUF523 family)